MTLNLADIKKRWQVRTVLALTLESDRISVDQLRSERGTQRVERSLSLPFGADAVLADPEKAGRELAAQLAAAGMRERRCVLCLPAAWALSVSLEVPPISGEDLRDHLELRAEREFPIAPGDLRLAHCGFLLPGGQRQVTLAALPAKRVQAVERMLATAECRAVSLSLGLDGCLPEHEAGAAVHFLANGTHVDLVIAAGGGIAALRSLPALGEAGEGDARTFCREVRITLGRLPESIRRQILQARFGGRLASAENLRRTIGDDLQRLGLESVAAAALPGGNPPPAAQDAALHYLREEPVIFEFLPPQINRWQVAFQRFDNRRRRWIAVAVLGLVVLPVLTFFIRSRMESSLENEWNAMGGKVADLEVLQQKIRQFRPWFEAAPQSVQVLEALTTAFPEAGDVWAKSVQLTEGNKVICTGSARSQSSLMALLERLRARPDVSAVQVQTVRGDNPVQFSFTYKWEARDAK